MVVAVEEANGSKGVPNLTMRFGRDPSTNCPATESTAKFPNNFGNSTSTNKFFKDNFGLTAAEVVTLLGIHTLGRTRAANSGFTFSP